MCETTTKLRSPDNRQADKLAFTSRTVPRLRGADIAPNDPSWQEYWTVLETASDAIVLIPAQVLRTARPKNLYTLLRVVTLRLLDLVSSPDFPIARPGVRALHANAQNQRPILERMTSASKLPKELDLAREALNCVRVLTRVLPYLYERASEDPAYMAIEGDVYWTAESTANTSQEQFVIDDEDEPDASLQSERLTTTEQPDGPLTTLVDLLFVPSFTLPAEVAPDGSRKVARVIWEPGIGSTTDVKATRENDTAKAEVVRLLVILGSSTLYGAQSSRFTESLSKLATRKATLALLCSLINVSLAASSRPPATAALSRSLSSAAGSVPGIGSVLSAVPLPKSIPVISRTTEHRRELGFVSVVLLDLLLLSSGSEPLSAPATVPPSPTTEHEPEPSSSGAQVDDSDKNVFRRYVAKLHRPSDFDFLLDQILTNLLAAADQGGLEGDGEGVGLVETLVLFWRVIDLNPKFLPHILSQPNVAPKLLCALLVICLERKDDVPPQSQASLSLIRLCVLLLQTLSAQRNFGARLNVPIESVGVRGASRGKFAVQGSVADFLIVSVYTLVCSTQGKLSTLYQALSLILVNCSPHMTRISVVPATRLNQLFLAFSAPAFLLAEESNPRLAFHMLEVINNIIHHHFSDNVHLVYAVIRSHRRFEELATFSLAGAAAEIRRQRADRRPELKTTLSAVSLVSNGAEDKLPPSPRPERDPLMSPPPLEDHEQPFAPMSEKARGKMRQLSIDEAEQSLDGLGIGTGVGDPGHPGAYRSRTGFVPTESWVASWRERLPLDSILILLTELRPKIISLVAVPSPSTNQAALEYLRSVSLVGLLPAPPPICARPFSPSAQSMRWLQTLIWSRAYLGLLNTFGQTRVTLFSVEAEAERSSIASPVLDRAQEVMTNMSPFFRRRASSVAGPRGSAIV